MVRLIEVSDVRRALDEEREVVVLDVLAPESFQTRHLPRAVNVPEEAPDFERQVQEQIPDKATPVIVYCGGLSCPASTRASGRLERMGYRDVREFKAGLQGWREAGLPFEGAPQRVRAEASEPAESAA